MKVLHLPLWAPNESDVQLGNFIQQHIEVSRQTHDVYSIAFFSDSNLSNVLIRSEDYKIEVFYPKRRFKWCTLYWYIKACRLAIIQLKNDDFEPELIHCHVAGRNLWFASKYFGNKPYVISEHWSGYLNGHFDRLPFYFRRFLIGKMNRAKVLTCASSHLAESLIEIGVKKRIEILQNVIQHKEKKDGNVSDDFTFLIVADLVDEVKNITGVIEAISLLELDSSQLKLSIVGGGRDQKKLERLVKDKGMHSQVTFHGRCVQSVVQEYLLNANCLIVNSRVESYSMVTVESILTGCPVIATRCGGPEQFINGDNGILINTNDVNGLKDAILEMIRNKAIYTPEKVRNSIVNVYSEKSVKNHLDQIYRKAIE